MILKKKKKKKEFSFSNKLLLFIACLLHYIKLTVWFSKQKILPACLISSIAIPKNDFFMKRIKFNNTNNNISQTIFASSHENFCNKPFSKNNAKTHIT